MKAIIHPGGLKGMLCVPASKSMMQRTCAGALLHKGKTTIANAGDSEDDKAALAIIQQLGATVKYISKHLLEIDSKGIRQPEKIIYCGESGLSARLFTPIVALSEQQITITGKAALLKRPMDSFESVFNQLGLEVLEFRNTLPITFKGPLTLKDIEVDGAVSSQFLTGLLFVYGFTAKQEYTITVQQLTSKPYIELTLSVLQKFGINISHKNFETFYIAPHYPIKKDIDITVEGDWSSAAFWLVGGAINGRITIDDLSTQSVQADKAIYDLLIHALANIKQTKNDITVEKAQLQGFEYDATDSPDLIPILAILATQCKGQSFIKGLHRLVHKESNRIESIKAMLNSFEVQVKVEDNSLIIQGCQLLKSCTINSYNDHRIAMAASIGATIATGAVTINDAGCVAKSYPNFYKDLAALQINTQLVP